MLPDGVLSSEVVQGSFNYPDNLAYRPGTDYELGGLAISDSSLGLEYQAWKGFWEPSTGVVTLHPGISGTGIPVFTTSDVIDFTFTFDQSMRWTAATIDTSNLLSFRWYDITVNDYVISTYSDIASVKLALDDKRAVQIQSGVTDVILTYVKLDGDLCYRLQRDRYLIEYTLESDVPEGFRITNFGMTDKLRVQWRLQFN